MKRVLVSAAALFSATMPVAAHAAPLEAEAVTAAPKQAVCVPVIVDTPEGPVEGILCFPQGGRV